VVGQLFLLKLADDLLHVGIQCLDLFSSLIDGLLQLLDGLAVSNFFLLGRQFLLEIVNHLLLVL
jgi:hypothetical protein